jgi:hypothetical protein
VCFGSLNQKCRTLVRDYGRRSSELLLNVLLELVQASFSTAAWRLISNSARVYEQYVDRETRGLLFLQSAQ